MEQPRVLSERIFYMEAFLVHQEAVSYFTDLTQNEAKPSDKLQSTKPWIYFTNNYTIFCLGSILSFFGTTDGASNWLPNKENDQFEV